MFANCSAGGIDISGSDVCKTPPLCIPIPYPNLAFGVMAIPNVPNILYCGGPVHNLATIIPVTFCDEPGACGGVVSGTVKGPSWHITCKPNFLVGGAPITRLTSINTPNTANTVGVRLVPSQLKILVI